MKNLGFTAIFALLMVATLTTHAVAADGQHEHGMMGARDAQGDMMQRCKAMMAQHEEMKTRVAALDAELDELLAQMDAARGKDKVDTAARVIHALVNETRQARDMMAHGNPTMMAHMTEHMSKGMSGSMQCPMMLAMMEKEKDTAEEDSHAEHH